MRKMLTYAVLSWLMVVVATAPGFAGNTNLMDRARDAGENAASRIFPAASSSVAQDNDVLRNRCITRAEETLEECQEAGGEDCLRIYDRQLDACVLRYPEESGVQAAATAVKWYFYVAGGLLLLGIVAAAI